MPEIQILVAASANAPTLLFFASVHQKAMLRVHQVTPFAVLQFGRAQLTPNVLRACRNPDIIGVSCRGLTVGGM